MHTKVNVPNPRQCNTHMQPGQKCTLVREINLGLDLHRHFSRQARWTALNAAIRMVIFSPKQIGQLEHNPHTGRIGLVVDLTNSDSWIRGIFSAIRKYIKLQIRVLAQPIF